MHKNPHAGSPYIYDTDPATKTRERAILVVAAAAAALLAHWFRI